MRDIKFRAWIKQYNTMWYQDRIFGTVTISSSDGRKLEEENQHLVNLQQFIGSLLLNKVELMQYTGLKDKNGKEIYEGDIIKWGGSGLSNDAGILEEVGELPKSYKWLEESCYTMSCEVVGNIYENPELLK